MKTYLITGGAGFIGSNFVHYLVNKWGDDVKIVVLDALTYAGNLANIADILSDGKVEFVHGDIGDSELVSTLLSRHDPDYIVNFAAESHVDRSITGPRVFIETNVLGTHNMLECARLAWQGREAGHKFLQVSTDEVYGSLSKDFDTGQAPALSEALNRVISHRTDVVAYGSQFFTESTPIAPRSPYSASKASADLLTLAYHHTYGLPVNITRCSNNYGPYHFPEKLIPLIINNTLQGKALPVYGRGLNVRDWLYVEDHCKAIDLVLRHGDVGEIYNVGGFNEQTNIDIVRQVIACIARIMRDEPQYRSLLSCPLERVNEELITFVTDRPGHDMRYAIDPTKIASTLGWYPETPFSVGLERTIRWNLDNHEWVKAVTNGDYLQYYEQQYANR